MNGTHIQGGYFINIEGTHADLVKFYNHNNQKIGDDDIRNGDGLGGSDITIGRPIGGISYVAVRHGTLRDLVYAYAVLGDKVYRSQQWRDIGPGDVHVRVTAVTDPTSNGFEIVGIGYGRFEFSPWSRTWNCTAGNSADYIGSTIVLPIYP